MRQQGNACNHGDASQELQIITVIAKYQNEEKHSVVDKFDLSWWQKLSLVSTSWPVVHLMATQS